MRNWKTTISGILTLAFAGLSIWQNPASATDPQVIGAIAGGVGLIVAKDAEKPQPPAPPK